MQPLDVTVYGPVKNAYNEAHDTWMKQNAGSPMQIMHIPMLARQALHKGASRDNVTSGFRNTGICPFNSQIFKETDFIDGPNEAKQKQKYVFIEAELNEDEQRRIVYLDVDSDVTAIEIVTTDESPSVSSRAASEARAASDARVDKYVSILDDIGPVQNAPPKTTPKRGPKPGKATILTSPENVAILKEKQQKRQAAIEEREAKQNKKLRQLNHR